MSFLAAHEDNNEIELVPDKGRGGQGRARQERAKRRLKRFSSTCLPNFDALPNLLPPKIIGRSRRDPVRLEAFGSLKLGKLMNLPYFEHSVPAGYPSGVDDPFIRHLDISRYLIMHPRTAYYYKASGYSMINAGINHEDLLVVDVSLKPKHRDIVIAVLNGEFIVKRFCLEGSEIRLVSANPDYPAITIRKEMAFFVQGVVTTVIRAFNPLPYDNHFKDLSYAQLRTGAVTP